MALGYAFRYYTVGLLLMIFPIVFLLSLVWLPEGPSVLIVQGREEDARKALVRLRGKYADIEAEVQVYKNMNKITEDNRSPWRELVTREPLINLARVCILFVIMHFTGYYVVAANTARIFSEAGSTIDNSIASVIVSSVQFPPKAKNFPRSQQKSRKSSEVIGVLRKKGFLRNSPSGGDFGLALMVFFSSLGMWATGSVIAFSSVIAYDLETHNTTIYGDPVALSSEEFDQLSSLKSIAAIPGACVIALVMTRWGRRLCMAASGVLMVVGWLGIVLIPGVAGMLISRVISGFGIGGLSISINTYVVELADLEVRGTMATIVTIGIIGGQVVTMALGYAFRYYTVGLLLMIFPVVFLLSLPWLPEGPSVLIVQGREEDALKALVRLYKYIDIEAEVQVYKNMNKVTEDNRSPWRELVTREPLIYLARVCILFVIMHFTGEESLRAVEHTIPLEINVYDNDKDEESDRETADERIDEVSWNEDTEQSVETKDILGFTIVNVKYGTQNKTLPVVVIKCDRASLLGRNWWHEIKFDWKNIFDPSSNYVHNVDNADFGIDSLLNKYKDVFDGKLGCLKDFEVSLKVNKDAVPVYKQFRTVPYNVKPLLEKELKRPEEIGVIKPVSFSEWASRTVNVIKSDGENVRICADFKETLNLVCNIDQYPLPVPEDIFATLARGHSHSKLDLSHACHQLKLSEESQKYMIISTHKGLGYMHLLDYNSEGVHTSLKKVQAIDNFSVPVNKQELGTFCGMVKYYHRFLPNVSRVVAPLYELEKEKNGLVLDK
ncbi:uncharacterized protein [Macrobrachium rosenbergii]|uniref:uncharacterized protein n=1 Tax=Macrobrachium rosenbergii TaxID=79674 RepID=UPI0034D6A2C0